jgi:hypothetical protein
MYVGVNVSQPTTGTTSGTGGPCPPGHYCPAQTSVPDPCPIGTYRDTEFAAAVGDCHDCYLGHYCDSLGQTNATGPCDPGFYCLLASDSPTPTGQCRQKPICPGSPLSLTLSLPAVKTQ